MIPILVNHNHEDVIGFMKDGVVSTTTPLSRKALFNIFGDVGIKVIECYYDKGEMYISKFEIICWSAQPDALLLTEIPV